MSSSFNLGNIYDKNLNILIGAGASFGLFPTLALNLRGADGNSMTVETLATQLHGGRTNSAYTALFMHYYKSCIDPVLNIDYSLVEGECQRKVLKNYTKFIQTILLILSKKKSGDKKTCNVFTTNYDGCLAYAAEEVFRTGGFEFHLNDGTRGFQRRYLDARNFDAQLTQTGVFGRHRNDLAQINLIHLHGSGYWYKDGHRIQVDYTRGNKDRSITGDAFTKISAYSHALLNSEMTLKDLPLAQLEPDDGEAFWKKYDALPIVNPTKWKFHETVFEEHYYQMLRYLSYQLESSNSVLLTFGFSFADEHIRNLIKRSLSNPSLLVFICCFNETSQKAIEAEFNSISNVQVITVDDEMDFTVFNEKVFADRPLPTTPVQPNLKVVA
jgi:hypothetical protein